MKSFSFILIFFISLFSLYPQAPDIEWQNTIGGSTDDILYSLSQTLDGGYILGG